ncbi:drs2 neo1 protein, partial [Spiromyces aspiralis]
LCHTVQPDFSEDTGEVVSYQATSPDEKALVSAAAEIGYIVSNRAGSRVQLRITDPERQRRFIEGGYKEVRKAEAAAKVAKRKMRKIEESKKHSESSAENRPVQNAEGNAPHVGYKDENAPGVSSRPSSATETTAPLYTAKMRMLKRPVGFNVGGDSGDEDDENLGERALIIPPDDSDMYEDYEVLDVIEFTSTRKRMSVIYRCPNGKIILLTKGADSVIWERLIPAEKAPAESAQDPFVPSLSVQRSTFQNSTSSNSNGLLYYRRHVSRPRAAVLHSRSSSTNSIDYVPRPSHIYPESPTFGSATNTRPQTPSQLGRQGSAIPRHLTRHTRSQSHSSAYLIGANVPRAHTPLLSQELRSSSMSPLAAPDNTSAAVDLNEARNTSETVISVPPPPALADSGRSSTSSTPTPHHPAASEGWGLGLDIGRSSTSTQRVSGDPPPSKGDGEDQESTMHPEMWNRKQAQKALYLFATEGLRTLVYAHREIPASEYEEWHERYVAASTALVERQKQIEQVADELERNLCLTGVSAIEDRLQDGVPETIYKLRQAGIKIWMLTGDKVETAINIAKSCRLIDEDIVGCSDGLSSESDSEMSGNDSLIILQGVTDAAKLRSELERAFKNLGVSIPDLKSPTRLKRLAYATLPYFVARRLFEHGRHGSAAANKASELPRVPLWQHGLSTGANTHFSEKATDTSTTASSTAADTNAHKDNKARSLTSPPPLAIVIDGETLQTLEHHPQLLELFLELGVHSNAVVCSRVSPAQKALIVHHMRIRCQNQVGEGKYAVTVAVGDGGNDIAMIQESHVGIGIAGQEGLQAARSADFSISQFRFLQRLILVHGRWSYIRISSFTMGTFYKCMAFYLTQALYQVFTGFSGTSLYESWTLSMYNTLFSLLPVIVIGVFDQDLQADTLLKHPELYPKMGPANHIYTVGLFVRHVLVVGLVHCCLVVLMILVPDFNLGDMATSADLYTTGFVLFTVMVFVVTFKISYIDSRRWTWVTHAGAALSLVLWFGWNGLMGIFYPDVTTTGYFAADVFQYIKDCGAYWALIIVVTAIALCITLLFRMSHILTNKAEREIQAWVIHERSRQRIERKISKGAQTIGTARNTFCKRAT